MAVAELPPDGAHEYVNGPVPETTVTVADPLHIVQEVEFVLDPESTNEEVVTVTGLLTVTGTPLQFVEVCWKVYVVVDVGQTTVVADVEMSVAP